MRLIIGIAIVVLTATPSFATFSIVAIDPETGAKTIDPGKMPDLSRECVVCPDATGARSWPPASLPTTRRRP